MQAHQHPHRRGACAEHGVALGDHRASIELRPEDELPVGDAQTDGGAEGRFGAVGMPVERRVIGAVDGANAARVDERSDVACEGDARTDADLVVTDVLAVRAGGHPQSPAESHGERVAVGTGEPQIGADAKIAEAAPAGSGETRLSIVRLVPFCATAMGRCKPTRRRSMTTNAMPRCRYMAFSITTAFLVPSGFRIV